ncbi:unnamed protein product [Hermetia illucens]|uniref:GATOR2 complex protein WDR24 n=1 Tax=Hermetia illucens TaxID=343691 RepID=A0A7R8UUR4_HERIL|nr:GATOR complex protein WDR24 [Hermetia illucens]CAD7087465.1 unnamed protein product [Hermetia illucens]
MAQSSTTWIRICQDGHANGLALNRDCTQIAVAGRSLLKIFSIEYDGFTEVCNMRGGKNQNLSYSSNDVAWSTLDHNILATAATNGVVSVWDLSKFGRQKQLLVYNEHERTAHTVTFHSSEPNLLLSGSQDGTIKCFDLRLDKSVNTYFSNSESVRDVKFSPHSTNTFAAVSENGTVQLWDIRKSDKCTLQFTAHSEPIYTCDWHPNKNWLATGSRDKQIKVWNMEGKASSEYTIHTIAAVGRVKWRPDRLHHIASCAVVVDYSIHIWDIRRPFIPFASFNEHTNITTGIAWKGSDPHVLLSASKDSTIFKHAFKDATYPVLKANPQGASLNCKGELLYAYKIKPVTMTQSTSRNNLMSQKSKAPVEKDQFHLAQSQLYAFTMHPLNTAYGGDSNKPIMLKDFECFIGCAKEYILNGKKLSDICEHNASISKKYGKHSAAILWNYMKAIYGSLHLKTNKIDARTTLSSQSHLINNRRLTQVQNTRDNAENQKNEGEESDLEGNPNDDLKLLDFLSPKSGQQKPCFNVAEPLIFEKSQITFENVKCLRDGFLYVGPHDFTKDWSIPETALHNLQAARPQPEISAEQRQEPSPPPDPPSTLKINVVPTIPMWEPHRVMADCLTLQADVGDIQTSLSILIAMNESRSNLPIEDVVYENWFHSYVEQLHNHQLWNEATRIINLSWIRSAREVNQQSTTVHTNCGECGRPLVGSVGWYCGKCKSAETSKCSVCHLVVRGLYAWCQGCSHGGHLEHMKQWFANRKNCPKCGHLCEYE